MGFLDWFKSNKVKECEERLRHHPDNPSLHFELGVEYERLGKYQEAAAAFQETVRLDEGSAEAHYNLGCLYEKIGDGHNAIVHMIKAGNLFAHRNAPAQKEAARTKVQEYYHKFKLDPGEFTSNTGIS
jgi:Flp pilus assembly protein TadD